MEWIEALGYLAGGLSTIAFLPQAIKTWKSRSARDLSLGMFITLNAGLTLWLVYGILLGDLPIIAANTATLLLAFSILYYKLRYD